MVFYSSVKDSSPLLYAASGSVSLALRSCSSSTSATDVALACLVGLSAREPVWSSLCSSGCVGCL